VVFLHSFLFAFLTAHFHLKHAFMPTTPSVTGELRPKKTAVTNFTGNNLNQYTALSGAKTAYPLHDDDSNLTDCKNQKY
jgi:hypothetical protein